LFGTLKAQSFILTEVSDCGLLNVVIFYFSQKKRYVKRKKELVQDLIQPPSIYIHMCIVYTYMNTYMPRFSPSGFFGPSRCLIPTPLLTTEYPICAVRVCMCVYTRIHPHTLPPALKIEKTQTTPLSFLLSIELMLLLLLRKKLSSSFAGSSKFSNLFLRFVNISFS